MSSTRLYKMWIHDWQGNDRYLYSGKEIERTAGLNLYDFHARLYDPQLGLFHAPDPLATETPKFSPYLYCAANPILFTDPTGMRVNFTRTKEVDQISTNTVTNDTLNDLQEITGLTLTLDDSNYLQYLKDENDNPIIAQRKNEKNEIINIGSETAGKYIMKYIDSKDEVGVAYSSRSGYDSSPKMILLSPRQIQSFLNGAVGVDGRTLGYGMTFLHEGLHSKTEFEATYRYEARHFISTIDRILGAGEIVKVEK